MNIYAFLMGPTATYQITHYTLGSRPGWFTVLFSSLRHFTIPVPLSTREYTWVPANYQGNLIVTEVMHGIQRSYRTQRKELSCWKQYDEFSWQTLYTISSELCFFRIISDIIVIQGRFHKFPLDFLGKAGLFGQVPWRPPRNDETYCHTVSRVYCVYVFITCQCFYDSSLVWYSCG